MEVKTTLLEQLRTLRLPAFREGFEETARKAVQVAEDVTMIYENPDEASPSAFDLERSLSKSHSVVPFQGCRDHGNPSFGGAESDPPLERCPNRTFPHGDVPERPIDDHGSVGFSAKRRRTRRNPAHRPERRHVQHRQPDQQSRDPRPRARSLSLVAHGGILRRDSGLREGELAL
jgi:hypothetical protein